MRRQSGFYSNMGWIQNNFMRRIAFAGFAVALGFTVTACSEASTPAPTTPAATATITIVPTATVTANTLLLPTETQVAKRPTPAPTQSATPTETTIPTSSATRTPATAIPAPPISTPTARSTPTALSPTTTPTNTPPATATADPIPTATATATATALPTSEPTATQTPPPTQTPEPAINQALADEGGSLYQNSCSGCHSRGSNRVVGPGHKNVYETAKTRVPGLSAEDYLRQSITNPAAFVVLGFSPVMPQFSFFTDQQILALIEYLKTL